MKYPVKTSSIQPDLEFYPEVLEIKTQADMLKK